MRQKDKHKVTQALHAYKYGKKPQRPGDPGLCHAHRIQHFRKYHRFFMIGPLFWLGLLTFIIYKSQTEGAIGWDMQQVLMMILVFVLIKEGLSYAVSKRVYQRVLQPLEHLRDGMEEVASGNYELEVKVCGGPEIRSLIVAFNKMAEELKAAETFKKKYEQNRKELIANISHDLKTPITSINGYVDGIVDGVANSPEKIEKYTCIIQQNAKYMNRLIDDLVLYSKLDIQKLDFHFQSLDLCTYIEELYNEILLEMEEQGYQLSIQRKIDRPVYLKIDGQRLTRAIRNIVSNALKYNEHEQVKIDFELFDNGEKIGLCIHDNGPGIPQDKLDSIFHRFYRGDAARTSTVGGSGLGLAIAKEIVNAHQGEIRATSQLGAGTTICIEWQVSVVESGHDEKETI